MERTIATYDADCVHVMGDFQFAFNVERFYEDGGGRLELWKGNDFIGRIKACFPVGMNLEDLVEAVDEEHRYEFPDEWLFQVDRAYLENPQDGHGMAQDAHGVALYNAAFEAAKMVGAAGIVSEWDEPAAKELWAKLAPKYGASIEERSILIGQATDNPSYVPVYIALFKMAAVAAS